MDLTLKMGSQSGAAVDGRTSASTNAPGHGHGHDETGPKAFGDPMGTPSADERVLWKGRPDAGVLARTAFHTRSIAIYFALLSALAYIYGSFDRALIVVGMGALCLAVLYALAHVSARTSLYILTDVRLILRIGMAIETRINVPLKHVSAANLKQRGKGYGDIALELKGERLLGYFLLWPHVRPFRFQHPQPMLRAVAEAEGFAVKLAEARSAYGAIERNLTKVNAVGAKDAHTDASTGFSGVPA